MSDSSAPTTPPALALRTWPSQAWHLVLALRPKQWAKNLLVYLAFFFTLGDHAADGTGAEGALLGRVTLGFVVFCALSGATYIVNDLFDMAQDKLHPKKRTRPLASGRLHPAVALAMAAALAGGGVAAAFVLDAQFGIIAAVYLALTMSYTMYFKDQVLLDVLFVSGGFVLRAAAGAVIIDVPISPWLYVMTSLGALLISLGKRRSEMESLGNTGAEAHRPALQHYTREYVDQLIAVVAPSTLVAYTLYTFTAENLPENNAMMLTIPFVVYGLFRYLFLIHRRNMGGEPEEILLTDVPMLVNIAGWLGTAILILVLTR